MAGRIQALVSLLVNVSVIQKAAGCMVDWRKVTNGQSAIVGVMQIRKFSCSFISTGEELRPPSSFTTIALALKSHVTQLMPRAHLAGPEPRAPLE